MKIEDQVVSLDIAKRLEELGCKQDSLFYHYNEPYDDGEDDWVITNWFDYETATPSKQEPFSAYSVAELGELLPVSFKNERGNNSKLNFYIIPAVHRTDGRLFVPRQYILLYREEDTKPEADIYCSDYKEANCRGLILIYLLENRLI